MGPCHSESNAMQEEQRQKDRGTSSEEKKVLLASRSHSDQKGARPTTASKRDVTCYYCNKKGHFKRECRKLARDLKTREQSKTERGCPASTDLDGMLVAGIDLALSAKAGHDNWIVDSGATCHMSNNENLFAELRHMAHRKEVKLGDGHQVVAIA